VINSLDIRLGGQVPIPKNVKDSEAMLANFGTINCYMVCPPKNDDNQFILANSDNEARLLFHKHFKKIPYHVSLVLENAAVLEAKPRIVNSIEEGFALGCQFAARSMGRVK
jgi:hypothetical protein